MKQTYISDQDFQNINCTDQPFERGEYENCTFRNCSFEYADLSGFSFTDCEFITCNLSMTKLVKTAFRSVYFKECKMFGLQFNECNGFGLSFTFDGCALNNAVFYTTSIKKTVFKNSKLIETDFAESDLSQSVFKNCDLSGAIFDRTNLEKADLRTSFNYSIDPSVNRLKKAKFSLSEVHGLLYKLDIEIDRNQKLDIRGQKLEGGHHENICYSENLHINNSIEVGFNNTLYSNTLRKVLELITATSQTAPSYYVRC